MNRFVSWDEMAIRTPREGAEGRIVHGDSMSLAVWNFEAQVDLPRHAHPHEQITHVITGEIDLTVGDETRRLSAGMSALIPGGVEHSVRTRTKSTVVDAFHPVREDLR